MLINLKEQLNTIRIDLMNFDEIHKADLILTANRLGRVETAEYTNEYTNLTYGATGIFIDLDAFSYSNIAAIYFNEQTLKFELRILPTVRGYTLDNTDGEALAADLMVMSTCLDELNEIDFKELKTRLDRENLK